MAETKGRSVRRGLRRALIAVGLLGAAGALAFGGYRTATLPLRGVEVTGNAHADADALVALAALPDSARLFSLDPEIIADRVQRDPWVREARVARWMTGTLAIRVAERAPAALVLDPAGRPAHYLDAEGYAMPATKSALAAGYDVPLLVGRAPAFHPTQPVEDAVLVRLLAALAAAGPATDALVAAVERGPDGGLTLITTPTPAGEALPVALGRGDFPEKLRRLQAFWEQAVLPRPEHRVRRVDLRFRGQVVTEEA